MQTDLKLEDFHERVSARMAFGLAGLLALAAYAAWLAPFAPTERPVSIVVAVFVAALVSSVAGFAFPAIAGVALFHLLDSPVQAVQIMLVCSIGGQTLMVWTLRASIMWRSLPAFLVGAAAGLPLGLFVLLHTPPAAFGQAMAALLLTVAILRLVRRPRVCRRQHVLLDAAAGFLGGVTGGAAALPSMFVLLWCGFKGWTKHQQRGLYQPFILIVQVAAVVSMMVTATGPHGTRSFDFAGIAYLPPVLLGSVFGMAFFRRMDERHFAVATNAMLIASGLGFLV